MNIADIIQRRYSTKHFQPDKPLSPDQLGLLQDLLQLSASSTNAQPWRFVLATSEEGKQRIARATQGGYQFNEQKILDASAVVVFASMESISEEYLLHVLEVEDGHGRYKTADQKEQMHGGRRFFVNLHQDELKDVSYWARHQVYLNVGGFLTGTMAMGLDSIAMEGFDGDVLDEELGLSARGYRSCVIVAVGYHQPDDFNAALPKSRLDKKEIIEII